MNRVEEILNDFLEDDKAEDAIVLSSTTYLSVKDVRTILNIYAKSQEGQREKVYCDDQKCNDSKGEICNGYCMGISELPPQ